MIFTDIHLQNFRSYKDASFELGGGVNIVVGPNATGKTNLIEALMVVSVGKTYRSNQQMITSGLDWARIDAHTTDNQSRTVKIKGAEAPTKEFVVDDKNYRRLPQSKNQPIVLFEPNNLNLLHGEPSIRRSFIDNLLIQTDANYSLNINKYKRVVAQRNSLLKQGTTPTTQLFVWDVKFVELASAVVAQRNKLIEQINESLSDIYSIIAGTPTKVKIEYLSKTNTKNYTNSLMAGLQKNIELDSLRGFTGLGPHRDDIGFVFGDKNHSFLASRGETRSLVLALKIIELQLIEKETGQKPLLLLDDVFSELDGLRRKTLTNYLKDHQTIITTTDADIVMKNFSRSAHLIALSDS